MKPEIVATALVLIISSHANAQVPRNDQQASKDPGTGSPPPASNAKPQQPRYVSNSTRKTGSQAQQPGKGQSATVNPTPAKPVQASSTPPSSHKSANSMLQSGTPPQTSLSAPTRNAPVQGRNLPGLSGNWQIAFKNADGTQSNGVMKLSQRGADIEGWGSDPKATFQIVGKLAHSNVILNKQYIDAQNRPVGERIVYSGIIDGVNPSGPYFLHMSGQWKVKDKQGVWEAALTAR